ncbi:MAG: NAD(P)/FAD-dependent oxidoreductase [Endozoicomonas sp.]
MKIAVVGGGISGLSCAWLLSSNHDVWLYEKDDRFGGHSHTVRVTGSQGAIPVDTGFIVFNEKTYRNLTALFQHLDVSTVPADFSCGVSLNQGRTEYLATSLTGLFGRPGNVLKPEYWKILFNVLRFYHSSHDWLTSLSASMTLRELLESHCPERKFIAEHLLPIGCALWSIPPARLLDYPALVFLRFFYNHGLLQSSDRPQWLTVKGGSSVYTQKLRAKLDFKALDNRCVRQVRRHHDRVVISDWQGGSWEFDQVVMACHADISLRLLSEPDMLEQKLLGAFRFSRNRVLLSSDQRVMPRNRKAWASWNYQADTSSKESSVTYWMNRLQQIDDRPLFLTVNPLIEPDSSLVQSCSLDDHPLFDSEAIEAQKQLWKLQGRRRTWFCGAWFGYGFHEDGLQSGLTVAERLGGHHRPWQVDNENDRLTLPDDWY